MYIVSFYGVCALSAPEIATGKFWVKSCPIAHDHILDPSFYYSFHLGSNIMAIAPQDRTIFMHSNQLTNSLSPTTST